MCDAELVWALKTGDLEEITTKLLTAEDVNRTLVGGRTPLHHAADANQPDVMLYLLSKGADINVHDKFGLTPLMCACFENSIACVKILLEKGAAKELKGPDGADLSECPIICETIKALFK